MNLGEASGELAARGFDYLPDGRRTIMLNNAKNAFEDQWRWPWLEQTLSGRSPLAAPGLKHVLYVQDVDAKTELLGLSAGQVAQGGSSLGQNGGSAYWWLDGPVDDVTLINTWPSSGAQLSARVLTDSPELVADTDTPLIPKRYHPIWVDFAVVEAYKDSDNYAGAQALRGDIGARIQDLILRYEVRNLQHSELISLRNPSEDD